MRASVLCQASVAVFLGACGRASTLEESMESLHFRLIREHIEMCTASARMEEEERRWVEAHRRAAGGKPHPERDRLCAEHGRLLEEHRRLLEAHEKLFEEFSRLDRGQLRRRAPEEVVRIERARMEEEHRRLVGEHRRIQADHDRIRADHVRMLQGREKN